MKVKLSIQEKLRDLRAEQKDLTLEKLSQATTYWRLLNTTMFLLTGCWVLANLVKFKTMRLPTCSWTMKP